MVRKLVCCLLILCGTVTAFAEPSLEVDTKVSTQLVKGESGILMEASTGDVLYEWEPDKKLQIASVTKTMTMLLIMEAIDSGKIRWEDTVTVSEHAASMGGSQVFLEVGECMSVSDMLKAIAVASGNDAAVAMAEHIAGTHETFVELMNRRAQELGCNNTHFINCNGLDETEDHYSCARDIAVITKELLSHPAIFDYTTIWMDTLRDGSFGLSNTNRLIRFYKGANGMKTGSTSLAKYCLSATALRDGVQLIAVVLGAPSTADRFGSATALLDYGFANYEVAEAPEDTVTTIEVRGGKESAIPLRLEQENCIVKKGNKDKLTVTCTLPDFLRAPIKEGEPVGEAVFSIDGTQVQKTPIFAETGVERIGIGTMYLKMLTKWL
ncbi:MAG: D-alanyl-D-alanine carboxypeptidase [Clostridia bacterium]|nr:D-alanyl-D-alanine carboxypeptidase [Clostridia bacterium]